MGPGIVRFHDLASLVATVIGISAANALVRPIVVRFLIRFAVLTFGLVAAPRSAGSVGHRRAERRLARSS